MLRFLEIKIMDIKRGKKKKRLSLSSTPRKTRILTCSVTHVTEERERQDNMSAYD